MWKAGLPHALDLHPDPQRGNVCVPQWSRSLGEVNRNYTDTYFL